MKNRLKKLFRANAGAAARRPFDIRAEAESDEAEIYLYDAIGWPCMEAQDFIKELQGVNAEVIHLHINSPGGDVWDAQAMQTALRRHKAKVIAHIDGLAASAATSVAMGADEIEITEGGFFMIHRSWCFSWGNSEELLNTAEMLEKIDSFIIKDYMRKTGKDEASIRDWMKAETWFSSEEALEHGFVDRVFTGEEPQGSWNLDAYDNVPENLKGKGRIAAQDVPDRATLERRLRLFEDFGN